MRGRAVTALAFDRDLDRVARRVEHAFAKADLSRRMRRRQMQSVGALDAEALEDAGPRSWPSRRLCPPRRAGTQSTRPATSSRRRHDDARGAEQHRDVTVVTARVHVLPRARAVRDRVLLVDRKRVHVGAQHDRFPRSRPAQDADDAGLADPAVDVEAELAQTFPDQRGRAVLLEA